MSLGFSVSRWAMTLIRKSIVVSIGLAVFGKGLQYQTVVGRVRSDLFHNDTSVLQIIKDLKC